MTASALELDLCCRFSCSQRNVETFKLVFDFRESFILVACAIHRCIMETNDLAMPKQWMVLIYIHIECCF